MATLTNEKWTYTGEVKNGKAHGRGVRCFVSGNKIEGFFKNGDYYKGTYTFADGVKYIGGFKLDEASGKMVRNRHSRTETKNYVIYSVYKNGKKHGKSITKYNDGDVCVQIYKNGEMIKHKYKYSKDKPKKVKEAWKSLDDDTVPDWKKALEKDGPYVINDPKEFEEAFSKHWDNKKSK